MYGFFGADNYLLFIYYLFICSLFKVDLGLTNLKKPINVNINTSYIFAKESFMMKIETICNRNRKNCVDLILSNGTLRYTTNSGMNET